MEVFLEGLLWLVDSEHWSGHNAIPLRVREHVLYAVTALAAGAAIAVPVGLWTGHTGRLGNVAINVGNLGRAIPDLGIVAIAAVLIGFGILPVILALTALAIPPLLTNTYTAVRGVDAEVRDAAVGMGFTGWRLLRQVEIPLALPLIFAGVRVSTVQVIATATISGFIGRAGGLGRYIFDGLALLDIPRVVAGAVLVALLGVLADVGLARLQRAVTPKGFAAALAEREAVASPPGG